MESEEPTKCWYITSASGKSDVFIGTNLFDQLEVDGRFLYDDPVVFAMEITEEQYDIFMKTVHNN